MGIALGERHRVALAGTYPFQGAIAGQIVFTNVVESDSLPHPI
jgi:hypothetical protein